MIYKHTNNEYKIYIFNDYIFTMYLNQKSKNMEILITKNKNIALTTLARDDRDFKEGDFNKDLIKELFSINKIYWNEK